MATGRLDLKGFVLVSLVDRPGDRRPDPRPAEGAGIRAAAGRCSSLGFLLVVAVRALELGLADPLIDVRLFRSPCPGRCS